MGEKEFLKRKGIKSLILDAAGEVGLKVAKKLPIEGKLSEFKLAERLGMDVNDVRSILYKLYNRNFVSYDKRRDEEKGWYIYHWKLLKKNLIENEEESRKERIEKLEEKKERLKGNQFFKCSECGKEYDFSEALSSNFLCAKCDAKLERVDKSEEIEKIKEKIAELR